MPDDPKPNTVDEPKTFNNINNASTWPAWMSLAVSALVTVTLAYSQYKTVVGPPTPAPAPTPVVVVEPVKIAPDDAIATLNGIRLNAERTKLLCDLVNAGEGQFVLRYQPVGKAEIVRTVVVSGGDQPAPVQPPKPDEPLPKPPPVDPNTKVSTVTYFYEKDETQVPSYVSTALNKINRDSAFKIVAAIFEDDSTNGGNNVPSQYKTAYEAAKKAGLPAVVVTAGDVVLKTIKAPKTESEIVEAAK
jgi:hypothetical protein